MFHEIPTTSLLLVFTVGAWYMGGGYSGSQQQAGPTSLCCQDPSDKTLCARSIEAHRVGVKWTPVNFTCGFNFLPMPVV